MPESITSPCIDSWSVVLGLCPVAKKDTKLGLLSTARLHHMTVAVWLDFLEFKPPLFRPLSSVIKPCWHRGISRANPFPGHLWKSVFPSL